MPKLHPVKKKRSFFTLIYCNVSLIKYLVQAKCANLHDDQTQTNALELYHCTKYTYTLN